MLAYLATKGQFLIDAPNIEDKVNDAVYKHLHLRVGPAEYSPWRNSLGNAMYHVMNSVAIRHDAVLAVELRLNGRWEFYDDLHPANQARSYLTHLRDFSEYAY